MRLKIGVGTVVLATLLAVVLWSGCGQPAEKAPKTAVLDTFVGRVEGSSAYIALISDGQRLAGFVTDGKLNAKWFATAKLAGDGGAHLVSRDGLGLGTVKVSDDSAVGEIKVSLAVRGSFKAQRVSVEGGLFTAAERKRGGSFEAGWIVLPDGSERGSFDTFRNEKFTTHPAPKLEPTVDIPGFGSQVPHEQSSLFLNSNAQAP